MATIEQSVATGVSFALIDEQKGLRDLAHEFAVKEIRPKAADYDEHQTHPADVVAKAHALGLMNLHVPERFGGLALSAFDGMLVGEELNWGCSGIGTSSAAATSTSSTARRPSSRTRVMRRGPWCSRRRTRRRGTRGSPPSSSRWTR